LVEQSIRNRQVIGSSPIVGSMSFQSLRIAFFIFRTFWLFLGATRHQGWAGFVETGNESNSLLIISAASSSECGDGVCTELDREQLLVSQWRVVSQIVLSIEIDPGKKHPAQSRRRT
jgi:hypothetical protein